MYSFSEWDTAYINSLPNAAFAIIEPAYTRGDTEDKRCRHLPHHSDGVKDGSDSNDHIDMDHLRNAWQRRKQIEPVTDSISQEELVAKAERHLKKHIKDLELDWGEESKDLELIPGQFSLSKNGYGHIRLVAPLKATIKTQSPYPSGGDSTPTPDLDEFLHARFRALSKIYIADYFLDLRKNDVLKNSTPLLKDQTVYADHRVSVHNWLGVVEASQWDEQYNPPGIDADIKIDIAANPKIVRGLTIQPPAIHSASVTFWFLWSKSHPDLSWEDFITNLGEEMDGEIVRFIVDEITQYGELSLVWQGADPYAKRKLHAKLESFRKKPLNPHKPAKSMVSGVQSQGGEPMDPQEEIKTLRAQIETLQKENDEAIKARDELQAKITTFEKDADLGKKYREELVQETESLYRLLNADKINEDFIKLMIHDAPVENLQVLKKDYESMLSEKLFFTCPHCGKQITSLRRSKEPEPKPETEKPQEKEAEQHKI